MTKLISKRRGNCNTDWGINTSRRRLLLPFSGPIPNYYQWTVYVHNASEHSRSQSRTTSYYVQATRTFSYEIYEVINPIYSFYFITLSTYLWFIKHNENFAHLWLICQNSEQVRECQQVFSQFSRVRATFCNYLENNKSVQIIKSVPNFLRNASDARGAQNNTRKVPHRWSSWTIVGMSRKILVKLYVIKIHQNPWSSSEAVMRNSH